MNIVFLCRKNFNELAGGDKIQLLKTKAALERLGINVRLSSDNSINLDHADIVHVFNPSLISIRPIRNVKAKNIPLAISTIYWDMKEYYESILKINREYLRWKPDSYLRSYLKNQILGLLYNAWWYRQRLRHLKKVFQIADILLPNSNAEQHLIEHQFRIDLQRFHVVPNAMDIQISTDAETFYRRYQLKDFILCAGRLEYRKNQYLLLKAMMDNELPLVLIGNTRVNSGYTSLCRYWAEKRGHVVFIDHLPQEELYSAYLNARVHVIPSWYETPGLSNLEAGFFGCNLVVSDRGSVREYFGNEAEYCDPWSPLSIREAVLRAYQKPRNNNLKQRILSSYTWGHAAKATLNAYQLIIEKS